MHDARQQLIRTSPLTIRRVLLLVGGLLLLGPLVGCESGIAGGRRDVWAVRVISTAGPDQYRLSNFYADSLRRVEQLDAELVTVIVDEEYTHVYYGSYVHRIDPLTNEEQLRPDPRDDLELIRILSPDGQSRPFARATVEPLPAGELGDPTLNAENVDAYWSLQVAVFLKTADFRNPKQAAVDYAKYLRDQGFEAYFHHAASLSSVVIGAFPQSAVVAVQKMTRAGPLSAAVKTSEMQVVDPRLRRLREQFPWSLENPRLVRRGGLFSQEVVVEAEPAQNPSLLVELPKVARERTAAERELLW